MTTPAERIAATAARYDGPDDEAARLTEQTLDRLAWRIRNGGKECRTCERTLPASAFGKDARESDSLARVCQECRRRRRRR